MEEEQERDRGGGGASSSPAPSSREEDEEEELEGAHLPTEDPTKQTIEGMMSMELLTEHQLAQNLESLSVSTTSAARRGDLSPIRVSNTSSPALQGSRISTPTSEISPAALSSLRGTTPPASGNSPFGSQVSVGSVPPTLAASLLAAPKHYDLTPVTRNTSAEYVESSMVAAAAAIVTPDAAAAGDEDDLRGEHLALPTDLSSSESSLSAEVVRSSGAGPPMPPLRTSSVTIGEISLGPRDHRTSSRPQQEEHLLPEPIQFPSTRKFHTFTSREQYEEALRQERMLHQGEAMAEEGGGLTPYQPGERQAHFDIESLPEEELERIFNRAGAMDDSSSSCRGNHRLLNDPVPMEHRIPSLRLAHHLHESSHASLTSHTDEDEDSLVYLARPGGGGGGAAMVDDDASLSSRGSSLFLPEEHGEDTGNILHLGPARNSFSLPLSASAEERHPHEGERPRSYTDDEQINNRRKRKLKKREERAYAWLKTVEADQNVLAEAASSRFLTGNSTVVAQQEAGKRKPSTAEPLLFLDGKPLAADLPAKLPHLRRQSMPAMQTDTLRRQASSPAELQGK